jgi:hypothetical protein
MEPKTPKEVKLVVSCDFKLKSYSHAKIAEQMGMKKTNHIKRDV